MFKKDMHRTELNQIYIVCNTRTLYQHFGSVFNISGIFIYGED